MEKKINLKGNPATLNYTITNEHEEKITITIEIQGKSFKFDHFWNKDLALKIIHEKLLYAALSKYHDAEYFAVSGKCIIALNNAEFTELCEHIDDLRNTYGSENTDIFNAMLNIKIRKIETEISTLERILKEHEGKPLYTKKELRKKAAMYDRINTEGYPEPNNPYRNEIDIDSYNLLPNDIEKLKKERDNLKRMIK